MFSAQSKISKRLKISLVLFLAVWVGFAAADTAPPLRSTQSEIRVLRDRFQRALREEAVLRREMEAKIRVGIRPYREYLFYQQSLRFPEHSSRLEQLERERREIAERLALMEEVGLSGETVPIEEKSERDFPIFSGIPIFLSWYDIGRSDPTRLPSYGPFWTNLFRFLTVMTLLLIFILPVAAIVKEIKLRRRTLAPVVPISAAGRREEQKPEAETPKRKAA